MMAHSANILGNLVNRTISMSYKYFDGIVLEPSCKEEIDSDLIKSISCLYKIVDEKMDELHISEAIDAIFDVLRKCNKYIDDTTPWILAKDETKKDILQSVMNHLANVLRQCAILLSPVLLDSPNKLFTQLNIEKEKQTYLSVNAFDILGGEKVVEKSTPLFPRLDTNIEIEFIKSLMGK